jgi:formate dehydrogenase subunit gamma
MKLSPYASRVLATSMHQNDIDPEQAGRIERLVERMPEDRVLLYKNVESNPIGDLPRFSIHIRIQHMLIFVSFLALALTGLPIHFGDVFWAAPLHTLLGGIEVTRVIHRTLAIIMILAMLYHLATLVGGSIRLLVQRRFDIRRTIVPLFKDVKDFHQDVLYFSGRRDRRPEMDKFMYKQKLHYFAAAFGMMVLVTSGSSFLFPEIWAQALPAEIAGQFQELMRISHPHEAVLALLVIAFWHWYNVHLAPGRFPMQWTFLTGKLTREHQIEEHFLEYLRCLVELPEERKVLEATLERLEAVREPSSAPAPGSVGRQPLLGREEAR